MSFYIGRCILCHFAKEEATVALLKTKSVANSGCDSTRWFGVFNKVVLKLLQE